MTKRYVGSIELTNSENPEFTYPKDTNIPQKQNWNTENIWEDNGKIIKPVNQHAVEYLDSLVNKLEDLGFTRVKKNGNRKTTSLKYAIQAHTEKFNFLKN